MATDVQQIERAIIGGLLLDPERAMPIAVQSGVDDDWFASDEHKLVWSSALSLWAEHKPIDSISVIERSAKISARPKTPLSGVNVTAADVSRVIDETPTSAHFEYYINLGRNEAAIRRIKKAGARFSRDVENGIDAETAALTLSDAISKVIGMASSQNEINIAAVADKIRTAYRAAHQKRIVEGDMDYTPGIPLPWKSPNRALQGVNAGLYYLGARPSVGKTAFILNLVRFWCERGVKVMFNSLDMAVVPLLKRPISEISRVSLMKASFGTTSRTDLEAIDRAIDGDGTDAQKGLKSWPLSIVQDYSVESFRSRCIAARKMGRVDVAIVDFVQLLNTSARYANENERLKAISNKLKSIAIEMEMPVIALSQLSRACEEDGGRIPRSSDLLGSGALEADATSIWMLHADMDVYKKWSDDPASRPLGLTVNKTDAEFLGIAPVRFIIAKNQNGQAGPDTWFPFLFFKKYCLFMLGDFDAKAISTTTGVGATKKPVSDHSPKYTRVTHDWRCDPFEVVLHRNGALVGFDLTRDRFLVSNRNETENTQED